VVRYTSSEAKVSPNHLLSPILVSQLIINIISLFLNRCDLRLRFRILTDQIGQVNPYLKKIKNSIILVKKIQKTKVIGLQPGFSGSPRWVGRVTSAYDFFYFFINLTRFQSRVNRVRDRPAGPNRVSKLR
jgi:hypothetical protein